MIHSAFFTKPDDNQCHSGILQHKSTMQSPEDPQQMGKDTKGWASHGGATTTGPDATPPPAICQNLWGGGGGSSRGSGGGVFLPGVGGGVWPGVRGASGQG